MANSAFMDRLRSFLGLRQEPPRNDFRNPIWSSDDEDEGDELYTRQQMNSFHEQMDLHNEFVKQMHDIMKTFGSMFGDMGTFFNHDNFEQFAGSTDIAGQLPEPESFDSNNIRDYYLKPGYRSQNDDHSKEDIDLDGHIFSNDISSLLKQRKDDGKGKGILTPFNSDLVPGQSFCQTIITTSITKPDGSVETKRIIKNGNEVIEERTTTINNTGPLTPGSVSDPSMTYNPNMPDLSSLFKQFFL